jgi:hypothetical protein
MVVVMLPMPLLHLMLPGALLPLCRTRVLHQSAPHHVQQLPPLLTQ